MNPSALDMKRALVIDDEPIINRLNKKLLSGIAIESESQLSFDFLKGEKISQVKDFDILIIDLNLIKKDSSQILERIKKAKEEIPVLITSGYLQESAEDILKSYSRISYLQKPYTIDDFLVTVKKLLEA